MAKFKWTPKRRVALECLIQARGNVSRAAELSKKHSPSVSYGYLQELKYAQKYRPFREEYNRRTGELLHAMEVNTEYVIQRYVELTRLDMPPATRRQALRDLGQFLGLWGPKRKEVEEDEATKERLMKAIEDEPDPEKRRKLIEAVELLAESLSAVSLASRINAGLHSDEELVRFLKRYLGVTIPDKGVCPEHQPPFSFVADVFLDRVVDAVVWSCRSGGKSFNQVLITFLDSHFRPQCDTRVLAGSYYQGKQVYDATLDFWDEPGWSQFLASEPTRSETLLKNGSGFEVLTASQKSVRGPHPQRLKLDEVDELARDLYDAAMSQPQSKHGIPASVIMTSTMHRVYGLMQEVIDNRHKMGLTLYKWCFLEVIQRCDQVCENIQDPESVDHGKQCSLWEDCRGRAHDAVGYYVVEDVRKKKAQLTADTWESEWLVKRPTARDMIYDPEDLEAATTEEISYDSHHPSYGMVDPGFVNPTAFCIGQEREDDVAVVAEWYWERVLLSERVRMIKEIYRDYGLQGIYADAENRDFVEELRAAGTKVENVSFAAFKDKGVQMIRQFLRDRRLKISTTCPNLIREMFRLHFRKGENIAKEDDHGPDALVALFRRYIEITHNKVVQTVRLPQRGLPDTRTGRSGGARGKGKGTQVVRLCGRR